MLEKLSPILPSRDIVASQNFYETLRFVTVYIDNEYLLLKRDGAELHFFLHHDLDPKKNDHGAYLRPSNVDILSNELEALGLPCVGIPRLEPANDKPWGMRELALVDPDGNLIRAGQEIPHG